MSALDLTNARRPGNEQQQGEAIEDNSPDDHDEDLQHHG
jgi:hypothetical protein